MTDRLENLEPCRFFNVQKWWAMLGSNQRPLPCEGSALPLS